MLSSLSVTKDEGPTGESEAETEEEDEEEDEDWDNTVQQVGDYNKDRLGMRRAYELGGCTALAEYITAAEILLTTDPYIIDGFLNGNLPRQQHTVIQVSSALRTIEGECREQSGLTMPGIYAQFLVYNGNRRNAPSPAQWLVIVDEYLARYQSDAGVARLIDQMRPHFGVAKDGKTIWDAHIHTVQKGWRKYLCATNEPSPVSDTRLNALEDFIAKMKTRIGLMSEEEKRTAMMSPLCEVGYSSNVQGRLLAHRRLNTSCFLLHLCESAFRACYQDSYHVVAFPVFACFDPTHGSLAEIVFSRLGSAYTYNAGGFSYTPAGISVASCDNKKYDAQFWNYRKTDVKESNVYKANVAMDQQRLGALNVKLDGLLASHRENNQTREAIIAGLAAADQESREFLDEKSKELVERRKKIAMTSTSLWIAGEMDHETAAKYGTGDAYKLYTGTDTVIDSFDRAAEHEPLTEVTTLEGVRRAFLLSCSRKGAYLCRSFLSIDAVCSSRPRFLAFARLPSQRKIDLRPNGGSKKHVSTRLVTCYAIRVSRRYYWFPWNISIL